MRRLAGCSSSSLAVVAGAGGWWVYQRVRDAVPAAMPSAERFVDIPAGAARTRSASGWSRPASCAMR